MFEAEGKRLLLDGSFVADMGAKRRAARIARMLNRTAQDGFFPVLALRVACEKWVCAQDERARPPV